MPSKEKQMWKARAKDIISIPEIAIVDREAELPLLTDDWVGEGWVKEER